MIKQLAYRAASLARVDRLLCRTRRGALKVLLYHNVERGGAHFPNSIDAEEFARHLDWLKTHTNVVAIDQSGTITGTVPDQLNVLITFDDGFINNCEVAVPILHAAGVNAIFFVIAACVRDGGPPSFQLERMKPDDDQAPYRTLRAADLRYLRESGMTIGSHSMYHTDYRTFDEAAMRDDALRARNILEDTLGEPVGAFAFPWGFHRPEQPQQALAMYERVFLTRHGFAKHDDRILPRNEVTDIQHLPHAVAGTLDLLRFQE